MRLITLEIERFTAFREATLEFSPGINVFIGVNGTGKSHLLKLLYSVLKAKREVALNGQSAGNLLGVGLAKKLAGVYRPDDGAIKRLVNRRVGRSKAVVRLRTDNGGIDFRLTTQGNLYIDRDDVGSPAPCVFIPSREALAMFEGFIRAYEERELSFDETYKFNVSLLAEILSRGEDSARLANLPNHLRPCLTDELSWRVADSIWHRLKGTWKPTFSQRE
ncbi:MAG: AAA family ATPase [Acidobacteriota bacterium]